jgi:hypothetical protein
MLGTVAKYWVFCGLVAATFGVSGLVAPSAQARDANTSKAAAVSSSDLAARSRPRITVYPRHRTLGPNAKRYCRFWLAKEYRVSGTVITPQQRCWWN